MVDFANPYVVCNKENKKVNSEELARLLRVALSSEFEAIQIYQQVANATDNKLTRKVLLDIANEETVHVGELLKLMKVLFEDEYNLYKQGFKEVEDMIEQLNES